jgi:hypothetical protein
VYNKNIPRYTIRIENIYIIKKIHVNEKKIKIYIEPCDVMRSMLDSRLMVCWFESAFVVQ